MRIPEGIPGFTAPPNVLIGPTEDPNGKYDAEGYGLLYLDENNSAEITNGGLGFDLNSDSIYSFEYNNSTYEIVKINKSWTNAASLAKQWGGKLVEINDQLEQDAIQNEFLNADITNNNTRAGDGGGGAYLWIGGNDFANEGNWTWDGKNEGNGTQFWDGNGSTGTLVPGQFANWGLVRDLNGDLVEPDDFQSGQDVLAISLDGWLYGIQGEWNDLSRTNNLFFIVEYEDKPLDSISARLFASAVRIYGQGYRPPKFEAIVENGVIKKFKLIQSGEGYYSIDPDSIYYIGDGINGSAPELNPITKGSNLDQKRNNVEDNSLWQVTNLSIKKEKGGWLNVPNVYLDWNNPNHDVYPQNLDFNLTLSHVEVRDPGYGYSVPLEIEVLGGNDNSDSSPGYVFRRAVIEATKFDSDLGITEYTITDPGMGYRFSPIINITGGGGIGATAFAEINFATGQVISVEPEFYGRGYRNVDSEQTPNARIIKNSALVQGEKNAKVELKLGGALMEPEVDVNKSERIWNNYRYPTPWFEILDRARPDISDEDKAEATAKVVDGNITKVIVTKSGNGYVDPYIKVYATPPGLLTALQKKPAWRCTQMRQNKDGNFTQCGHVQIGNEPPQNCPGEEDLKYRWQAQDLFEWTNKHRNSHELCPLDHDHGNGNFKHHSCQGGAETFKLINDPHRDYDSFKSFNLECSAITENGKIREIVIDKNGSIFFSNFGI